MSDEGLILVTDERLTEWARLASNATSGPWKVWAMLVLADPVGNSNLEDGLLVATTHDAERGLRTFNADFIAAAREGVPALISEVRALRAREAELQDAVEHQRGMYEREHNTVHELQQRISGALAPLDRWGGGVRGISLLDLPGLIRTALTETQNDPDQVAADQGRTGLGKD